MYRISKFLLLGFTFIFLISCTKNKALGLICYQTFQSDTLNISYGNQILIDSIITTNESIQVALLTELHLNFKENQYLYIRLNKNLDSVVIHKRVCRININNDTFGLKIQLDSICKPQYFY
jgi:hypothetical protein